MRHRLIVYDRATDLAHDFIDVPPRCTSRVLAIAGIKNADEPGEYPLQPEQVRDIAAVIGFAADVARFVYHLEPIGRIQVRFRD